ncbi:MAG: hypothetical protein A2Z88_03995 [Omnitrophica WOR_2 bacterium GWA2_47_8]|nr:MAG: hypothetical protein A2Z88_03995 [Omnitrophica WOR_2 bacterium GWA2_47_8]
MLLIFVLVIITVILFVIGISFILKGYKNTPEIDVKELDRIKSDLQLSKKQEEAAKAEAAAIKKELDETKKNVLEAEKLKQILTALEDERNQYKEESAKFQHEAHESSRMIQSMSEKLSVLETKAQVNSISPEDWDKALAVADGQAKGALEVIQALETKTASLEQQYQTEVEKLKNEIAGILQKADQQAKEASQLAQSQKESPAAQENQAKIENLTSENQKLTQRLQEAQENLKNFEALIKKMQEEQEKLVKEKAAAVPSEANADTDNLKNENGALKARIQEGLNRIQMLEVELNQLKARPQVKSGNVPEPNVQYLYEDFKTQLNQMRETVKDLNKDKKDDTSSQIPSDIQEKVRKLEELNRFLTDKEKILQSELTKSRMEAIGLKQICEDFKVQLGLLSE